MHDEALDRAQQGRSHEIHVLVALSAAGKKPAQERLIAVVRAFVEAADESP
jgi:hypothetical protein